jgi:uncharacterized lipoprotein YbaY
MVVIAPGSLPPGARVAVPLQTIEGRSEPQPGVVESSVRVRGGEHRVHIRFTNRINPARFAVCWGVSIGDDGALIEITTPGVRTREESRDRPTPTPGTARRERAANIVTIANELARRAAEGAGENELREIAALINDLIEPGGQSAS